MLMKIVLIGKFRLETYIVHWVSVIFGFTSSQFYFLILSCFFVLFKQLQMVKYILISQKLKSSENLNGKWLSN
jgi:hypothetical protein